MESLRNPFTSILLPTENIAQASLNDKANDSPAHFVSFDLTFVNKTYFPLQLLKLK